MNSSALQQKLRSRCKATSDEFFKTALGSLCDTEEEAQEAFKNLSFGIHGGFVFRESREVSVKALELAEKFVDVAGTERASVEAIRKSTNSIVSAVLREFDGTIDEDNTDDAAELFFTKLVESATEHYDFVGPCELFRFEDEGLELRSKYVSVMAANSFLAEAELPRTGKSWQLKSSPEAWPRSPVDMESAFTVFGTVWWVRSQSPADLTEQSAKWMIDVFMTAIRVGLRRPDYCLRPRLGQSELSPFGHAKNSKRGIIHHEKILKPGGQSWASQYKVDASFADRFHDQQFQNRLNSLFEAKPNSVGEHLANAFGWCSRGRQCVDHSERLLNFFTALESLLSEKDAFSPVAETIARLTSVVLSETATDRERTYKEIKKLYALRSSVVHQGRRAAHWLNANNIQHICESTLSVVFSEVDLSRPRQDFINELKSASHGGPWPKNND
ncbi:hypothetical protein ATO10_06631 [Actibacterium atlanticum]|uniref:Uncharacterized protein n=1 Tax=Actibacterium atlanticum TaxID=1461693 RepID=A0A058ZN38_9RHOB|nr:HEPN domain-containing protein [Actibacterium atlanticum]KCV82597.1 hypothetical protein ATO10_06631 [Actibacterium atlanticum]